jgi:hypothetical protein
VSLLISAYKPVVLLLRSRRNVVQITLRFRGWTFFSAFGLFNGDMKTENCKSIASSEK